MEDLDVYLPGIVERDEEAFKQWVLRAEMPLRRSLRRFPSIVDVESVVQETLLRIWGRAHLHVPDGKPNSLLRHAFVMAKNRARDEGRSTRRLVSWDEAAEQAAAEQPLEDDPPDPMLNRLLRRCLSLLGGKPGKALAARLTAGGESDDDLAAGLGMAVNTFRQNVSRARRTVQDCLVRNGLVYEGDRP